MSDVFLRALSMDDFEYIYKWHSDKVLYQTLVGPYRYVSKDAEMEWLQSKVKYSTQEINLMVCLCETRKPIGIISVREIDWVTRTGCLAGIMIGEPEYRGKGYGTESLMLMVSHCFYDLGLNRIWALVLDNNENSINMFTKCGFEVEGHLRQHAYKNGQFRDLILVGLCADQFFHRTESMDHTGKLH